MNLNEHINVARGLVLEYMHGGAQLAIDNEIERVPVVSTVFKNRAARSIARCICSESYEELPGAELLKGHYSVEEYQSDIDKALSIVEAMALNDRVTEYQINKLLVGSMNRILSDRSADIRFQYLLSIVGAYFFRAWLRFSHGEF